MKTPERFEGFSPETLDFMWGIRMNNNKPWFEAHKSDYVNYLYEPMKALGAELFAPYKDTPGMLLKVARIYRDMRMHPPEPYRDGLWLSIRPQAEDWAPLATFYFGIDPEGADYGFGLWRPSPAMMERFRRDLAARPQVFPALLRDAEEKSGLKLTAEVYKRPKPCPMPELEAFYSWKGKLTAGVRLAPGEELFTHDLADRIADFITAWLPVAQYFWTLAGENE